MARSIWNGIAGFFCEAILDELAGECIRIIGELRAEQEGDSCRGGYPYEDAWEDMRI